MPGAIYFLNSHAARRSKNGVALPADVAGIHVLKCKAENQGVEGRE
jgi:hypothetical protein